MSTNYRYLRASLHRAILDTLRASSRTRYVQLPQPDELEDHTDSSEVWEVLQTLLPHKREWRLAYLLYHCGLGPREIAHFCPREWSDVQEIYRLRSLIIERVLRQTDRLQWLQR